ncbi:hypothetical protein H257_08194 [Aphanomyces astaci]|uniref:Core domain-containing protein n=1 Tax=Aphanomyces astaci TaxID=112090 RepID=W4GE64_APHAT|nr:hypothetical protein H257_08194 [Aphanomyces astaci]ETV77965.1 hypothetical protein H257_08194 [Aphanomyces astaci]|eukprot:XP_009832302.1 hypothetical protein H257_08194 [Aphanomyces astaci]
MIRRAFSTAAAAVATPAARTSRLRREVPAAIKLTDEAAARIKELMASRPDAIGIRLGVRTRGCSGLSYTMNYATEKQKLDEEVAEKGVKVFIESKALFHVVGTTMDYKITPVSAEFTFENPNAKGTCGCGESFNV